MRGGEGKRKGTMMKNSAASLMALLFAVMLVLASMTGLVLAEEAPAAIRP